MLFSNERSSLSNCGKFLRTYYKCELIWGKRPKTNNDNKIENNKMFQILNNCIMNPLSVFFKLSTGLKCAKENTQCSFMQMPGSRVTVHKGN